MALDPALPEVAFVGRSNVGKSSLLNALVGSRIAKVSGTPGKTRMMNVYDVSIARGEKGEGHLPSPFSLYFLDLPGYGYARVNKTDREAFRRLVRDALTRERLRGVVWLLDIRHAPSAEDRAMQDVLAELGTRVLAAVTKGDKVPTAQRGRRERELQALLEVAEDQIIVTSAKTGEGVADLREAIGALAMKATE